MNILVLDKDTRQMKGSISQFESFIWTERYWDYGDFELVLPLNHKNVGLVSLDDYFRIPTSDTLMIVENIEYVSPLKDEGGRFNITGRSLDSIIDRRILYNDFKKSIKPEAYVLQMVKDCFNNISQADRVVDYLTVKDNTDEDVVTEPVTIDVTKGTNIGDVILSNLKKAELGFRIIFNRDKTFTFEVFSGKDKKYIVFSENNLLLQEAQVLQSNSDLKTFVVIGAKKEDVNVYLEDNPKGIHRRETYLDGGSYDQDDENYRKELELKGKNELEERKLVNTIAARLMNFGRYRLRRDYDLGDIVTIQNPYYRAEARITEVIQSWNQEGYQIYPGFITKNIDILSTAVPSPERPKPEKEPEPDNPDVPADQTPRKLINVELISAVKMYTNFVAGGSAKTYHQVYIPNYDPSDPDNRPIKKFGVRLRGTMPEGWAVGLYSIYCDVFLGSDQKLETIRIRFKDGDQSFIGEWFSYLTYDKPYIRLYLYVVANMIGPVDIPIDQNPFVNGLIDIRLNNIEQKYEPSEIGDDLTYQVGYYWEANSNFNRYYSGNSTNVNGIDGIEIFVKRTTTLANESILELLGSTVTNGNRGYEYDTVELDNLTLNPIETGIVTVPPYEQNFKIPPFGDNILEQSCQSLGFRDNVFEYIERAGANYLLGKGSNLQEVNMVLRKKYFYDETLISSVNQYYRYKTNLHIGNLQPSLNGTYTRISLMKEYVNYKYQTVKYTIVIKLSRPITGLRINIDNYDILTNDHDTVYTHVLKYSYNGTMFNMNVHSYLYFNDVILADDPDLDIEVLIDKIINERPGYPKFATKDGEISDIIDFSYSIPFLKTNRMNGSYNIESLSYPVFDEIKNYWLSLIYDSGNYFMEGSKKEKNLWGVYIFDDSDNILSTIYENYHTNDIQRYNEPRLVAFTDKNKIGVRITMNMTTETSISSQEIGGNDKSSKFAYKLLRISNPSINNCLYNYVFSDLLPLSYSVFNSDTIFNDINNYSNITNFEFDNSNGSIKILVIKYPTNSNINYNVYDEHDTLINFKFDAQISFSVESYRFFKGFYKVYDVSNAKTIKLKSKKTSYRHIIEILINPISYDTTRISDNPLNFRIHPYIKLSGKKPGYILNTVDQDNRINNIFAIHTLGIQKKIDISFTPNMTDRSKELLENRTYLKLKEINQIYESNDDGTVAYKTFYHIYGTTDYTNIVYLNNYNLPFVEDFGINKNLKKSLFIGAYLNSVENEQEIPITKYPGGVSVTYNMDIQITEREV